MVAEERSRVAPGGRPPTDRAGRAVSLGVDGDKRDGPGSHLVSGHPPTAPAARSRLEWMVTRGPAPGRTWRQATPPPPRPRGLHYSARALMASPRPSCRRRRHTQPSATTARIWLAWQTIA